LRGIAGVAVLLSLYLFSSSLAFDRGLLLNMIYPVGALLLGFTATQVYRIFFEQAQRQLAQELMARYLSPSVSQWVLKQPEQLKLGGDTRTMTVLFCDLRGFTTLSHSLEPQQLVSFINEYMTAMTEIIFRHDGVLDKYIGDEIMAFWNAPLDQPDHARRACLAALDMLRELHRLRASWAQRGLPQLDIGIGINTGPMVVGNMGSRDRLAYTVIGDTVNVASRLQSLNKELGTHVLITEATRASAGEGFVCRSLDQVKVRGRDASLMIYEISAPVNPEPASATA
jgi:adenylate cyclase